MFRGLGASGIIFPDSELESLDAAWTHDLVRMCLQGMSWELTIQQLRLIENSP